MLAAWIFFPLWEMVFVLRQLRVPRHRELADARAPRDEFEELAEMTQALIDAGFEQLDECRLRPAEHEQYYRIFVRAGWPDPGDHRLHRAGADRLSFRRLHLERQGRPPLGDVGLSAHLRPRHAAQHRRLSRAPLPGRRRNFTRRTSIFSRSTTSAQDDLVAGEQTREAARARLEETLNQQIEYNISRGYLAPAKGPDEENFCYSWRGTLYVAGQVLRDLLF